MVKDSKEYKELLARRDVLKLTFDLRCYKAIMFSPMNKHVDKDKYFELVKTSGHWLDRIDAIIASAENGLVDLTAKHEYDCDLGKRVRKLLEGAEESEIEEVESIEDEIDKLRWSMPGLQTFVSELMSLEVCFEVPIDVKRFDAQVNRLLELLPYRQDSSERDFILNRSSNNGWFSSYFSENKKISIEEHKRSLDEAIKSTIASNRATRVQHLGYKLYKWQYVGMVSGRAGVYRDSRTDYGVVLERDTFINLIESDEKIQNYILDTLGIYLRKLPIEFGEYFTDAVVRFEDDPEKQMRIIGRLLGFVDGYGVYAVFKAYFDVIVSRGDYDTLSSLVSEFFDDMGEFVRDNIEEAKRDSERDLKDKRDELVKVLKMIANK